MKFLVFLSFAVATVLAVPTGVNQWTSFKSIHNKRYENVTEEARRIQIFVNNIKEIEEHNKLFAEGKVTYTKALNQFADMTPDEFLAYVNKNKMPARKPSQKIHITSRMAAPAEVDWRSSGVVTAVKNQGQCGSCWSFSATGALEGQYAIKHGNLISLSEQNLVDCSGSYGNAGCNGGWMDSAFDYVIDHGIALESDYPYEAVDRRCRYNGNSALTAESYVDIAAGSESGLVDALANAGPVAVAIDATFALQFYSSGVLHDNSCSAAYLNHGVLAVGYTSDYWIVKNSWGSGWGESGYFRLAREGDHCGLTAASSYPVVA